MNENASYALAIEQPATWRKLPAGPLALSGWFLPKDGRVYHDLHFVVGGRRYPAWHGLSSPAVAAARPGVAGAAFAGFNATVTIGPGDDFIALETLGPDLRWAEIWRVPITLSALTLSGPIRPKLNHAWLPPLLQRHLQEIAGARSFATPASLDDLIRLASAESLEWVPAPPLRAALDIPRPLATAPFHGLHACGWAFHESLAVRRVYGMATVNAPHPFRSGMPPTDLPWKYAHIPTAAAPIFFGVLPIPPAQSGPSLVKIYVELEDGSHHLVAARRVCATAQSDAELPLPPGRWRDFLPAVESLHARVESAGLAPGSLPKFVRAALKVRESLRDWFSVKDAPFEWEPLDAHARQQFRQRPAPQRLRALQAMEERIRGSAPFIGLVTAATAEDAAGIARLEDSLRRQAFPRWELIVVAPDERTRHQLEAVLGTDHRVTVLTGVTRADAANALGTDYVALVDPQSVLHPEALLRIADSARGVNPPVAIYTDEEVVPHDGKVRPYAWSDWSPALALSGALGGTLLAVRQADLNTTGGWANGPAASLDALHRVTERPDSLVCHVACYGVSRPARLAPGAAEAAVTATNASLQRRGFAASATAVASPAGHCWLEVRWASDVLARSAVTIVIPTRDRAALLQRCVGQLEKTVDWRHVRLVIVDDQSAEPDAVAFLRTLAQRKDLPVQVMPGGERNGAFNYARLVNVGAAAATTPLVLHLNNDVDALEPGWLEQLVGWFTFAEVGAVGAKLVLPDGGFNHAGLVIDPATALPLAPLEGMAEESAEPAEFHRLSRDVAAVTGACLLTRTELYRKLGGFDAVRFPIAYNDVDYCLRLRAAGHRVVYSPVARLLHHGSQSRGSHFHPHEHLAFLAVHGDRADEWVNPRLRFVDRVPVTDVEQPVAPVDRRTLRLLVVTHNLALEGAPLFLQEFVEHAVKVDGFKVDLLAYSDGPLRAAYEALGVRITIVDRHPIHASPDRATYEERVGAVRRSLDLTRTDLVVTNTIVGFWAVELARQEGLPSLWFIHESTRVPRFFAHELMPGMQPVVHDAFREATRVVFLCEATRRYYDEYNVRDHYRILPGWVEAGKIREFAARADRAELRRRHGIGPDERVIVNVGTICERKGQLWFLAAAKRLLELQPGPIRFLLVGGLGDLYQEVFNAELAEAGVPGVQVVGKTDAVYEFYALADLAVCSSFEESFPRVLLEAMAFSLPVVSTNVHGVPEMIGDRHEGLLVTPGDVEELARTMDDALRNIGTPKDLAAAGLSKVLRVYDRRRLLPRHIALAREAAEAAPLPPVRPPAPPRAATEKREPVSSGVI